MSLKDTLRLIRAQTHTMIAAALLVGLAVAMTGCAPLPGLSEILPFGATRKNRTAEQDVILLGASETSAVKTKEGGRHASLDLFEGTHLELCREMDAHLKALEPYRLDGPRLCAFPVPDKPDFREIAWEALDPSEHMDMVRIAIIGKEHRRIVNAKKGDDQEFISSYWKAIWLGTIAKIENGKLILPDVLESHWQDIKGETLARIERGEILLQRARFNIDHRGAPETLYRYADKLEIGCAPPGGKTQTDHFWRMFLDPKERPDLASVVMLRRGVRGDPFLWKGRVFIYRYSPRTALYIIETGHVGGSRPRLRQSYVCRFRFEKQTGNGEAK